MQQMGLKRAPFADSSEGLFYFPEPTYKQCIDLLNLTVSFTEKISVVIGENQSGKTTLMNAFLQQSIDSWRICYFSASSELQPVEILQQIIKQFELVIHQADAIQVIKQLQNKLISLSQTNQIPVLIIDNAHLLSVENIKRILALYEFVDEKSKIHRLLKIVFFGDTSLKHNLAAKDIPYMNRQAIHWMKMPTISPEFIFDYIHYRINVSGGVIDESIYDQQHIKQIYQESQGHPGIINEQAHKVLMTKKSWFSGLFSSKEKFVALLQIIGSVLGIIGLIAVLVFQDEINQFIQGSEEVSPTVNNNKTTKLKIIEKPFPEKKIIKTIGTSEKLEVEVLKKIPQEKNLSSNKQQEKIKDKTIAPIKKITPKVVALTVKTSKKQKISLSWKDHQRWLLQQPDIFFTLQLVGVHEESSIYKFAKDYKIDQDELLYFHTKRNGIDWFSMLYGVYPDKKMAEKKMKELTTQLQGFQPWVRDLGSVKAEIQKNN
jgi:DamX protein